jgi:hypothetical protein
MKAGWIVQAALGTVALTVLQAMFSFVAPAFSGPPPGLGGVLASNVLTAAVLAWIHGRLTGRPAARAAALWAIWGGLQACSLVEAVLFDIRIPRGHLPWLFAFSLAVSGAFSAFLAFTFRPAASQRAAPAGWPAGWRVGSSVAAYVALYFSAGTLVWPYVRAFYEASPMPPFALVFATQLARGLALSAIVLVVVRRLDAPPVTAAVAAGAVLGIVGGVAPLLITNPYLPDPVRYAHLPEVGVSNFLFGLIAGWLLRPTRGRLQDGDPSLRPAEAAGPIG